MGPQIIMDRVVAIVHPSLTIVGRMEDTTKEETTLVLKKEEVTGEIIIILSRSVASA